MVLLPAGGTVPSLHFQGSDSDPSWSHLEGGRIPVVRLHRTWAAALTTFRWVPLRRLAVVDRRAAGRSMSIGFALFVRIWRALGRKRATIQGQTDVIEHVAKGGHVLDDMPAMACLCVDGI